MRAVFLRSPSGFRALARAHTHTHTSTFIRALSPASLMRTLARSLTYSTGHFALACQVAPTAPFARSKSIQLVEWHTRAHLSVALNPKQFLQIEKPLARGIRSQVDNVPKIDLLTYEIPFAMSHLQKELAHLCSVAQHLDAYLRRAISRRQSYEADCELCKHPQETLVKLFDFAQRRKLCQKIANRIVGSRRLPILMALR